MPRCPSATSCASSSFRSRASSTSAPARCSTSKGQLLPVEDSRRRALGACRQIPTAPDHCRGLSRGQRHVGIAVSHVLDVASGAELFEAGTSRRTDGVTLLKDCVTGVVRSRRRPALAGSKGASIEWNPARGGIAMSTVSRSTARRKQKSAAALVEICSVRLGKTLFGMPITPHSRNRGRGAARSPCRLRRALWAAWSTTAAMFSPRSAFASCSVCRRWTARRTSWFSKVPAAASACWSIPSAKC